MLHNSNQKSILTVLFHKVVFFYFLLCSIFLNAQIKEPIPLLPIPTLNQLRWQEMEYYAFVHFSINTYTNQAWGYGDEDINLFNPKDLDCRQWVRICKEAGMKGIIITAKHHSGFCLWPSAYTEYSVKNAPWKDGKGDVVRELADACKEYGLKMGIYLSPWDRNHPDYGKPEYITYFRNQLKELLTNYGEIFEIWFDGANGGSGYYGGARENRKIDRTTYYDWKNTYALIRSIQPNIVIWNDGGDRADLRWVGTEAGYVGETNWSLLNATGDVPENMLRYGVENGDSWVPGEVNTSIRPEWFYHPDEDARVKTLPKLLDTYYHSIGRNATFLLNFPIMPNGLIHQKDENAAMALANAVKEDFSEDLTSHANITASSVRGQSQEFAASKALDDDSNSYWTTDDGVLQGSLTLQFDKPIKFNRFLVQECIRLGQRVKAFTLVAMMGGSWVEIASETTIGYKRILRLKTVETSQIRFTVKDGKACPIISNLGIYFSNQVLVQPTISRNKSGEINIAAYDPESEIYYTSDGSMPSPASKRYIKPIESQGKMTIRAIAYDPVLKNESIDQSEQFGISKKPWKILEMDDENAYKILDGQPETMWFQNKEKPMPVDLIIDLGKKEKIIGFKYLPNQIWAYGIITDYELLVSNNQKDWKRVSHGEFSNIKSNPVWQTKSFKQANARYVKFRALKLIAADQATGYAEFDIVTK